VGSSNAVCTVYIANLKRTSSQHGHVDAEAYHEFEPSKTQGPVGCIGEVIAVSM
jgi:hypothetical protein